MTEKIQCPETILTLIKRYERHRPEYLRDQYNQTYLRKELIYPFFRALGWNVDGKQGFEEDPFVTGHPAPYIDHAFRIGVGEKFVVDTKKPWVSVYQDADSAFQIRKYGWEAALPLNILTNFEEFAVYNCTKQPHYTDKASTGRIKYYTYRDYEKKWKEIASIFSKDAVPRGSFDRFTKSTKEKTGIPRASPGAR
jgi:predicted type IV restriction endonuclease